MIYQFNNFELDSSNFSLKNNGQDIEIEPQVFNLITYLVENRNRLVTRDEIFEQLWGDKNVLDATLSNHIKNARSILGDDGQSQKVIKTVYSRGYQFIFAVNEYSNKRVIIPAKKKVYLKVLGLTIILAISLWIIIQYIHQQKIISALTRISNYQEASYTTFIAQATRRNELVKMLSERLNIKRNMQYEKFFSHYFSQMNGEEKFVFSQIRAMTETGLFKNNFHIVEELKTYPEIFVKIKHTKELLQHLTFWLNKYQSVFKQREDMCLLYVGVEDGLPYPEGVNQAIKNWLLSQEK